MGLFYFSFWFVRWACWSSRVYWLLCSGLFRDWVWSWADVMRGRSWRHNTCSHGLRVKYVLFYVLYQGRFGSVLSLFLFRSNRSPNSWIWRGGHLNRSWNEKTEEITQCQNFSSPGASGAKCVSFNRLFGSGPQSGIIWAGFQRWLVSFKLRNFIVASHGGSSFPLFCFRPLFRGSCCHAHQCDRSPASELVSFSVSWGAGAGSWADCD